MGTRRQYDPMRQPGTQAGDALALRAAWRRAVRVSVGYALLGAGWIVGSDALLDALVVDHRLLVRLETFKGWFYVAVTALLLLLVLYRLLRNDAFQVARLARQRDEIDALSQLRESIIDNASIWLNVLDAQARVTVWNKAAEQISGYPREEVVGSAAVWTLLYPDPIYRAQITTRAMAILDHGEEVAGFETAIRCRDGSRKTISWNSRRFFGADGQVGSIAIGQDITEHKRMQQELERLAVRDALTGLYNRHRFESLAQAQLDACLQRGQPFALAWLDIDGFKEINDRHGHQAGDEVLCRIATLLEAQLEDRHGIAARFGGDEMVVALPAADVGAAMAFAEGLRARVQAARLLAMHGREDAPSISLGVATGPVQGTTLSALAVAADLAMYRAKRAGRNRVCGPEA